MKNIADYLILESQVNSVMLRRNLETEERICYSIRQVEQNPYYLGPKDKSLSRRHYQLKIWGEYRFLDEDPPSDWYKGERTHSGGVIPAPAILFHETSHVPPHLMTIERFSEHIYKECRAAILAFGCRQDGIPICKGDWKSISLAEVFKYLKNLHMDYSKTEDFIKDFDFWLNRLWNTYKFVQYLSGRFEWTGCNVNIGHKIYEFLDLEC